MLSFWAESSVDDGIGYIRKVGDWQVKRQRKKRVVRATAAV